MHPPLFRPHPKCEDVVNRLVICHEYNKFSKFIGACNAEKIALDQCFKEEKEEKRKENLRRAREFDEKFITYQQKLQEQKAQSP
jgi:COX assembly protein 2